MDDAEAGMENALKANPEDISDHYEKQLSELKEAYGEAMLELKFRKKLQRHLDSTGPHADGYVPCGLAFVSRCECC